MKVQRCSYLIATNSQKKNGENLSKQDFINIGYLAGRCGISLDGNLERNNKPITTARGTIVNINDCTRELFEETLSSLGIKFDKMG